ncbi:potassium channel protein [Desulfohalobiaceae bacterium Ax17]|jgi:voltage-gated potassium channel|uniref:potassium channel family protein n=1 Tax=Desulfovulcanus ferrireducens TaxID=2831190 RepID=UPI00207BA93B|nr:potassium channel protein [Desulfovulcanus ferrireducens]MBT8763937.1 potassium channel protein [Desulfovulcanus ferrireducens]
MHSTNVLSNRFLRWKVKYGFFLPLILGTISLFSVFLLGIIIYYYVEGWTLLESFYQVVITLSTVGFLEVHPLSPRGRLLTSILILMGVGNFAYLVGTFTQILVEGRLQALWGKRKVQKIIDNLEGHFIVCGYGRIGSVVAKEILKEGLPLVVIEEDEQIAHELEMEGILHVHGDATSDQVLLSANLKKAKVLITTLSKEAQNVYVTLTARQLRPDLQIIARAEHEDSIKKLQFAGADRVLTPYIIGGMRMAQVALRPTVIDFLELALLEQDLDLQLEELEISESSELVGKDLIQSEIRPRFNLIVIAIKKASGDMIYNPVPKTVLEAGDTLVAVGKKDSFKKLQEIL